MGSVVTFPGHRWHRCDDAGCPWCAAGWLYCEVCDGASTSRATPSLTTDCCGVLLTAGALADVRAGALDFRYGAWRVTPKPSAESAELLEVAADLLGLDA